MDTRHSWNAPQTVTNWFVFRLQRHSDHHARVTIPYQALRSYPESPTLPTGYTGSMLCALAPGGFFEHCVSPVLDAMDTNDRVKCAVDTNTKGRRKSGGGEREDAARRGEAAAAAVMSKQSETAAAERAAKERMRTGVFAATSLVTCLAFLAR